MKKFLLFFIVVLTSISAMPQSRGQNFLTQARKGNISAMNKAGLCYHMGTEGLPQDKVKAAYWFEKGAQSGSADAMFNYARYVIGFDELLQNKLDSKYLYWMTQAASNQPTESGYVETVIGAYDTLLKEIKRGRWTPGHESHKKILEELIDWYKTAVMYGTRDNIRKINRQLQEDAEKELEELKKTSITSLGTIYDSADQMPSFPGGNSAMMSWLSQNIRYPALAFENKVQGRVVVSFVVEKDGSISTVKVVKSVDPSLDKEAVRVVSSMSKWSPGILNGTPVRVKYTLPVTFKM